MVLHCLRSPASLLLLLLIPSLSPADPIIPDAVRIEITPTDFTPPSTSFSETFAASFVWDITNSVISQMEVQASGALGSSFDAGFEALISPTSPHAVFTWFNQSGDSISLEGLTSVHNVDFRIPGTYRFDMFMSCSATDPVCAADGFNYFVDQHNFGSGLEIVTAVPEPISVSSMALLLAGLALLGWKHSAGTRAPR